MVTENTTPNRGYQEPAVGNTLEVDVGRLIAALRAIDVDVADALAQIVAKAGLASPAFTGTPTAPTAAPGTDTGQLATTAFVRAAIVALIDSSPGALDTLNELAAALGDDPNFSTTVLTAIGLKADADDVADALALKADAAETTAALALKQDIAGLSFGQCFLRLSGGNLVLARNRGRLITINGVHEVIPQAGVLLAPTGLTPSTLYYIYAYMNSGTMTLEASATAYAVDTSTGVVIKSGDPTRTLVGTAYPETGPVFTNTPAKRFVRSWFNDNGIVLFNNFTANRSTTAPHTTPQEINPEIRCQFLLWSGETVDATINGSVTTATASGGTTVSVGFNSAAAEPTGAVGVIAAANTVLPISAAAIKEGLTEGFNYATLIGYASASGQITFYGDTDGRRTSLKCRVSR